MSDSLRKFLSPRPPSFIDKAKISLSLGDIFAPNRAGMSLFVMMSSRGAISSVMSATVLMKYVYLCCSAWINAEKAAWG